MWRFVFGSVVSEISNCRERVNLRKNQSENSGDDCYQEFKSSTYKMIICNTDMSLINRTQQYKAFSSEY